VPDALVLAAAELRGPGRPRPGGGAELRGLLFRTARL